MNQTCLVKIGLKPLLQMAVVLIIHSGVLLPLYPDQGRGRVYSENAGSPWTGHQSVEGRRRNTRSCLLVGFCVVGRKPEELKENKDPRLVIYLEIPESSAFIPCQVDGWGFNFENHEPLFDLYSNHPPLLTLSCKTLSMQIQLKKEKSSSSFTVHKW